jgi:hypothetical protein
MPRCFTIGFFALVGWWADASLAEAQVFVRVPFVRVYVGPGGWVYVRAPFVVYSNMDAVPGPNVVAPPAEMEERLPPPRELPNKSPRSKKLSRRQ